MTIKLIDSRQCFLADASMLPSRESPAGVTRRGALRGIVGVTTGGVIVAMGFPFGQRQAEAGWVLPAALGFGAGLLSRHISKLFAVNFPSDPEELGLTRVRDPKPTRNRFHNQFADPFEVRNPKYQFPSTFSNRYGYFAGLDDHLRADANRAIPEYKDLNSPEIRRLHNEEGFHGTLLYPCGPRQPVNNDFDMDTYLDACRQYGVDPAKLDGPLYMRPVNDGRGLPGSEKVAFGVGSKKTGERDLLIHV